MGARILKLMAVCVMCLGLSACPAKPKDDAGAVTTSGDMSQQSTSMPPDGARRDGSPEQFVTDVGDRVFFGYDQYDLTPEARMTIERQAQWLKTYPNVNVMVEGHCDERGTREYNLALGEKRASALRNYLVANGVMTNRIQSISYGKERPAVLGADETSWAQNRRSVVVIQ